MKRGMLNKSLIYVVALYGERGGKRPQSYERIVESGLGVWAAGQGLVEVKKAPGHERHEKYTSQTWPSVDVKLREAWTLLMSEMSRPSRGV